MLNFFGTWDDLTLERVGAFLAEQEDEGLTWETKGTEIRPTSVLKAVCGFANQVGGFLIIGARREGSEWVLNGWSSLTSRVCGSPASSIAAWIRVRRSTFTPGM
jgi:hypothetical protein